MILTESQAQKVVEWIVDGILPLTDDVIEIVGAAIFESIIETDGDGMTKWANVRDQAASRRRWRAAGRAAIEAMRKRVGA